MREAERVLTDRRQKTMISGYGRTSSITFKYQYAFLKAGRQTTSETQREQGELSEKDKLI